MPATGCSGGFLMSITDSQNCHFDCKNERHYYRYNNNGNIFKGFNISEVYDISAIVSPNG